MGEFFPLLLAIVVTIAVVSRSKPKEGWFASTVRSYRKRPVATIVWLVLLLAIIAGLIVGPQYLARELYDTAAPSRDQIRTARIILGSPIAIPFLGLLVWSLWTQRKADQHMLGRAAAPMIDDPSKRSVREEVN